MTGERNSQQDHALRAAFDLEIFTVSDIAARAQVSEEVVRNAIRRVLEPYGLVEKSGGHPKVYRFASGTARYLLHLYLSGAITRLGLRELVGQLREPEPLSVIKAQKALEQPELLKEDKWLKLLQELMYDARDASLDLAQKMDYLAARIVSEQLISGARSKYARALEALMLLRSDSIRRVRLPLLFQMFRWLSRYTHHELLPWGQVEIRIGDEASVGIVEFLQEVEALINKSLEIRRWRGVLSKPAPKGYREETLVLIKTHGQNIQPLGAELREEESLLLESNPYLFTERIAEGGST